MTLIAQITIKAASHHPTPTHTHKEKDTVFVNDKGLSNLQRERLQLLIKCMLLKYFFKLLSHQLCNRSYQGNWLNKGLRPD